MAFNQGRWILVLKNFWNGRLVVGKEISFHKTIVGHSNNSKVLTCMRTFSLKSRGRVSHGINVSENTFKPEQFVLMTKAIDEFKNRLSMCDFEALKKTVIAQGNHVNEINFDSIFIGLCGNEKAFQLGKTYYEYLQLHGITNIGTIGKFFRLCYDCKEECSEVEKSLMFNLYKKLLSEYEILDHKTCENVMLGLSISKEWKECLKLLDMARFTSVPSTKMYSSIIEAAFSNDEIDLGWKLMNEMVGDKLTPLPSVYNIWLSKMKFSKRAFHDLFKYFEEHDLHPSEEVSTLLLSLYNQHNKRTKYSKITTIDKRGICQSCFHQLNPLMITESEFKKLREEFLNPVLIGKDIFHKTKPQEFNSFLSFLERIEHVDVVLDGLNIALSPTHRHHNPQLSAGVLCSVVKHFINLSKKVMVLGRKHMNLWPKTDMDYIKQNSSLFLVDNVSTDDPYLLYATMHFGLGTTFVSRDQMRSHKFLLKDSELMSIFSKWQQKHQYYFLYASKNGKISLMDPVKYSQSVQQTKDGICHIPISTNMNGIPAHLVHLKKKWLCFQDH